MTRNATRAISILMADFSCALKLSMPLAVLSAMRACSFHHITVKGGKYLEALAKADTIVFDKTGTLTHAAPAVAEVIPFGGWDEENVLRLAACLEEHYPHSMANAVVRAAADRGIIHEETHTQIEYVVAHGIASRLRDRISGNYRFVLGFNGALIGMGAMGLLAPASSALAHNLSILAISLRSMTNLLDDRRALVLEAGKDPE